MSRSARAAASSVRAAVERGAGALHRGAALGRVGQARLRGACFLQRGLRLRQVGGDARRLLVEAGQARLGGRGLGGERGGSGPGALEALFRLAPRPCALAGRRRWRLARLRPPDCEPRERRSPRLSPRRGACAGRRAGCAAAAARRQRSAFRRGSCSRPNATPRRRARRGSGPARDAAARRRRPHRPRRARSRRAPAIARQAPARRRRAGLCSRARPSRCASGGRSRQCRAAHSSQPDSSSSPSAAPSAASRPARHGELIDHARPALVVLDRRALRRAPAPRPRAWRARPPSWWRARAPRRAWSAPRRGHARLPPLRHAPRPVPARRHRALRSRRRGGRDRRAVRRHGRAPRRAAASRRELALTLLGLRQGLGERAMARLQVGRVLGRCVGRRLRDTYRIGGFDRRSFGALELRRMRRVLGGESRRLLGETRDGGGGVAAELFGMGEVAGDLLEPLAAAASASVARRCSSWRSARRRCGGVPARCAPRLRRCAAAATRRRLRWPARQRAVAASLASATACALRRSAACAASRSASARARCRASNSASAWRIVPEIVR